MSDEVPSDEQPGPSNVSLARSGSAPGETPKKGILKRPSIRNEADRKLSLIPFPGARASPDRSLPADQASKIPKLSVTWWEKNAVAIFGDTSDENNTDSEQILKDLGSGPRPSGLRPPTIRQTAILDSEEDSEEHQVRQLKTLKLREELQDDEEDREDAMSIASSTGSTASSIVGRWWTGKDMRFVPHCERKGCNHAHHNGQLGEYLTPTQRRNKEMSQLKKELRSAISERDEKDMHLTELRERIKEIEMLNDVQTALADSHKMMQRERETREQYEKEKKQMEKKHNIRVNQLVQETMNARDEMTRLTARIDELEAMLGRPRVEASTMTDSVQYAIPSTSQEIFPPGEPDPTDPSMFPQVPRISTTMVSPMETNPLSPARSDQGGLALFGMPSPMSISIESKISGQPIYLSQEALNHIQAYQNEAFIWRTKAAQLEMVIKEQLLKASQKEQQMMREKDSLLTELDAYRRGKTPPPIPVIREHSPVVENLSILQIASTPNLVERTTSIIPGECSDPQCIERKKNLIEENNQLLLNIEEGTVRVQELEDDVSALRTDLDSLEAEKKTLSTKLDSAQTDAEEKGAELTAGEITIIRLQSEKETMQKAISYMEERMQVYQNTLMDHDLVVSDETASNWRKGCPDPRYSVMVSKRIQTEMTSQDLSKNENEFASTKRMLKDLHSEFSAKRSDLHGRFEEIEQILLVKTQLVETLTKQLEDTRRDQRLQLDEHQKEREEYKKSLVALGAVTERVPMLEQRVQELLQELSDMEVKFKQQREEYETGLEGALEEALLKYKEQSNYWRDKVNALEGQLDRAKNELLQLSREKEESRLKSRLERVDLEQRLTSSIEHVALLNTQVNRSRRDVECEAKPKHVSKYVACRPNVKNKSTSIEKGDLFDEAEERLKLCQGELATTRRQVHVLQQKLISTIQERADRRLQVRKKVACVVERPTSADGRRGEEIDPEMMQKLESLETKNAELREKLSSVEEEKASIVQQERERIQHLAQEFENVRRELDQEMCRYDSEKKWLKSRIQNLEQDNKELQKQLEDKSSSQEKSKKLPIIAILDPEEDKPAGLIRKTLSEPELVYEDEEISRLKAENSRLMGELERVRESLRRTASAASAASRRSNRSQLSPAFGALADDLNMVKSDLEEILSQIDKEPPKAGDDGRKTPAASISRQPTPAEEEQLQSKILKNVMTDWETDEREALARDLRRSREERDRLKNRNDRMTADLNRANAELEVFRNERLDEVPAEAAGDGRLVRSRSAADLTHEVDREESARWKAKCGTMFRELNTVRVGYAKAIEDRRELKYQLATMRYELEMAKCQNGQPSRGSVSTAYFSPKSIRSEAASSSLAGYHTPPSADGRRPSQSDVIVHESPVSFRKGSNRESISCTIIASTSMRALNQETATAAQPRRAQSAKRSSQQSHRRRASSKEDYVAMEQRRSQRQKSSSVYATAPHSVTSSMTSLHDPPVLYSKPPPCAMSQSWHEPSTSSRLPLPEEEKYAQEEERSRSRAISLREKVGRLLRENAQLAAELEKKAAGQLDQERLARLEREKDALREQVELLLKKIQQEQKINTLHDRLEEQLTLSRQENEMYERKISEMEEERREMYLVMFKKGQQAAKIEGQKEVDQMTQDRVVLKFLHDAFFYFLMNRGDSKEHLQAIMTMLDFSAEQKEEILKRRGKSH